MTATEDKNENLEKQFQELLEKAKKMYPDIDDAISSFNNMTALTINLQDYLNLNNQTPSEISTNQISIS
jgi:flagellar biosynthesis regulator FlaF